MLKFVAHKAMKLSHPRRNPKCRFSYEEIINMAGNIKNYKHKTYDIKNGSVAFDKKL